ncbi:glycosyltransferase family 2 protein [Advenella sp. RU8]|uniref:glycosyltransferase family 2 protein n=1 Tax=Advenella sp. RU8 TaxID=3399575 RepID=UPI003AAE0CCE
MNNNPIYLTIGMPIYNAEKYLANAIKSVLAQTYTYWELILIDDGSTDSSLKIAQSFKDDRIRIIADGKNKKLPIRLNQIIREAKYDYIARMDADDLIPNNRIEKQIEFLIKNPHYDLVATSILSIKNNDSLNGLRTVHQKKPSKADALVGKAGIAHATIIAKKNWYNRNLYNETTFTGQDYELWIKAAINNDLKVGFLSDYLYYYREENNVTKQKMLRAYNVQIDIINKYHHGILTDLEYKKIIRALKLKKTIIKIASTLNLMSIIYKRRNSTLITPEIKQEYHRQLSIIKS